MFNGGIKMSNAFTEEHLKHKTEKMSEQNVKSPKQN